MNSYLFGMEDGATKIFNDLPSELPVFLGQSRTHDFSGDLGVGYN